ncbi:hypothetical protein CcrC1_gp205c [Caulobacter phage C1]|nr:hypothetical protein CcrC1_gp205c [Caulobacter phage C1]UTU08434.1 hypothetical protein CcrC2_gp206c [Caulobacter phage C2]UTU08951.1 hypothetical protein CcrJ4_gp200c [Caulobacter phage J4]UTU09509.1 hypothetical protein CcrBL47_gp223c [Caulobacter phage BL47]UTU10067.1 hypothetical protein CcrRB23_gp205c [Caulobacter phage RB23]WGN97102.1 hypothetical protein [Bertelyvirus sp.]
MTPDLTQIATITYAPKVDKQGSIYRNALARAEAHFARMDEVLKMPVDREMRAREIELRTMDDAIARTRERDREILRVPARLGKQDVFYFWVTPDRVEYEGRNEGLLGALGTDFERYRVLITSKQRSAIMGHPGGERTLADGARVEGDWRLSGCVALHLPGDQVSGGKNYSLSHKAVVTVIVLQDDLIARKG